MKRNAKNQILGVVMGLAFANSGLASELRYSWNSTNNYVLGGNIAALLGLQFVPAPGVPKFQGGAWFDDGSRSAFRLTTYSARENAALWSDWTRNTVLLGPILLDGLVLHGIRDRQPGNALRTAGVYLESLSAAVLVTELLKRWVARGRPYALECPNDSGYAPGCSSEDRNQSFASGHVTAAFAGAGFMCRAHEDLQLIESQTARSIVCASSISLATATAFLRMASDRHYFTDVLAGTLIGFTAGYFLPSLLHHSESHESSAGSKTAVRTMTTPWVSDRGLGLRYSVEF